MKRKSEFLKKRLKINVKHAWIMPYATPTDWINWNLIFSFDFFARFCSWSYNDIQYSRHFITLRLVMKIHAIYLSRYFIPFNSWNHVRSISHLFFPVDFFLFRQCANPSPGKKQMLSLSSREKKQCFF